MLDVVFRGRDRPLLIWIAPLVLVLMSIADLLFILLFVESSGAFSGGGGWMKALQYRLFFASIPFVLVCLQLVLAYGLAMERAWPRPLAVALPMGWVVIPAVSPEVDGSRFAAAVAIGVPAVTISLLAALYLYASPGVRSYYDRLALTHDARGASMHAQTR